MRVNQGRAFAGVREGLQCASSILIEKGSKSLKALADKIHATKMPQPGFKVVLTADGNLVYRNDDGILVCPIGCLRG